MTNISVRQEDFSDVAGTKMSKVLAKEYDLYNFVLRRLEKQLKDWNIETLGKRLEKKHAISGTLERLRHHDYIVRFARNGFRI